MQAKGALTIAALLAGVPLAAYGLAERIWPLAILGLVLVLVFVYLAYAWIAQANKPMGAETKIKPAANAAWNMKDEPAAPRSRENDKA